MTSFTKDSPPTVITLGVMFPHMKSGGTQPFRLQQALNSPADLGTRLGDTNRETDGGVSFRGGGKRGRKGGTDGLFAAIVKPVKRRIRLPTKWFLTPCFAGFLGLPPGFRCIPRWGRGTETQRNSGTH